MVRLVVATIALLSCLASSCEIALAVTLRGRWVWNEQKIPVADLLTVSSDRSFQRLEFLPNKRVIGFQYFSHAFHKGGEALESEAYKYAFFKDKLIFHSNAGFTTGWPNKGLDPGQTREACEFRFGPGRRSFSLSGCDLAGDWVRAPRTAKTR